MKAFSRVLKGTTSPVIVIINILYGIYMIGSLKVFYSFLSKKYKYVQVNGYLRIKHFSICGKLKSMTIVSKAACCFQNLKFAQHLKAPKYEHYPTILKL